MRDKHIAIVGAGRLGLTFYRHLREAGFSEVTLFGRDPVKGAAGAAALGLSAECRPLAAAAGSDILLLTVTDRAIAEVAQILASAGEVNPGSVAAHCSGALPSSLLAPLRTAGTAVAAFHPLQSFAAGRLSPLSGVYAALEGEPTACAVLERFAVELGMIPFRLSAENKMFYHIAAVTASNYLVTLLEACFHFAQNAGLNRDTAAAAFLPLITTTLANVTHLGPARALTGPLARGDTATVAAHLDRLRRSADPYLNFYETLAEYTVALRQRTERDEKVSGGESK